MQLLILTSYCVEVQVCANHEGAFVPCSRKTGPCWATERSHACCSNWWIISRHNHLIWSCNEWSEVSGQVQMEIYHCGWGAFTWNHVWTISIVLNHATIFHKGSMEFAFRTVLYFAYYLHIIITILIRLWSFLVYTWWKFDELFHFSYCIWTRWLTILFEAFKSSDWFYIIVT